jgi:hypothetical protein
MYDASGEERIFENLFLTNPDFLEAALKIKPDFDKKGTEMRKVNLEYVENLKEKIKTIKVQLEQNTAELNKEREKLKSLKQKVTAEVKINCCVMENLKEPIEVIPVWNHQDKQLKTNRVGSLGPKKSTCGFGDEFKLNTLMQFDGQKFTDKVGNITLYKKRLQIKSDWSRRIRSSKILKHRQAYVK